MTTIDQINTKRELENKPPLPKQATKEEYNRVNGVRKKKNPNAKTGNLPLYGTPRWKHLERAIKRDGRFCKACGSTEELTLDHIVATACGGSKGNRHNHQVLCSKCNNLKGNLLPGKNGWWPDSIPLPKRATIKGKLIEGDDLNVPIA